MSTISSSKNKPSLTATIPTSANGTVTLPLWRARGIGIVRIIFGFIWAIDAWFKWQPDFLKTITDMLSSSVKDQPPAAMAWINFWIHTVNLDPALFAHAVAIIETALAIGLILGAFSNTIYVVGTVLSLIIWSTAEGFGGPYDTSSTDIGAAIIYAPVFAALFFANAGMYIGVDRYLTPALKRFGFLASGPLQTPMR